VSRGNHPRSAVMCPERMIGTPQQVIKLRRGGPGHSGNGPSGYKMKPARVLARSLAALAAAARARGKFAALKEKAHGLDSAAALKEATKK